MSSMWSNEAISRVAMYSSAAAAVTASVVIWKYYARHIFFARLTSTSLAPEGNRRLEPRKRKLFSAMEELKSRLETGKRLVVVDVGSGSGANFRFYPSDTDVVCIDPNRHFEAYLRAGCADWPPGVRVERFLVTYCEKLDEALEPEVADAVVVAGLLCSVKDVDLCLRQIQRVLKPGGKLFFLEHVLSPPCYPFVRLLQRLMNPLWRFIMDGCNINRKTQLNIQAAGFSRVEDETFEAVELEKPTKLFFAIRLCRTRYWGIATK